MKQNVRKTDNRDLMTKLFDRGINVQGIAQSLYPELSQFQIHQMLCASGPYTKDDRNLLAQKIYNVWKTEASKPDYRLGESKNVKHVNESQLKSIIAESVKKVLKEGEYDSDMLAHRMEDYHQSNGEYYASEEWYVEFGKNKYNTEKYKGFESREEAEECANKIRNEHPEMKYVSVGVNGASKMMHESKTTNKLSESQLSAIVAESIKKVLRESYNPMDDEEACQFMNWAANSSSDIMQNIWGYYQSCREGNQNDANWYMEKILFAYANEKGCEESELNIKAIEKAINEWGYYNYNESLNESMYNDKDSLFKDSQGQRYPNVKNSYDYMEIARKALEKVVRLCDYQNPSGKKLGMAIENVLNIWQDYHNASDARGEMDYKFP